MTLLDTYLPDPEARVQAFVAIDNIPAIRRKAEFCLHWIDSINDLATLRSREDRRRFLLNVICFAACIEGLFFVAAFAYVYYLRSRGLLNGLASGTNWVFRDESAHMAFAFEVVDTMRREEPDLFDGVMAREIREMIDEAVAWPRPRLPRAESVQLHGAAGRPGAVELLRTTRLRLSGGGDGRRRVQR